MFIIHFRRSHCDYPPGTPKNLPTLPSGSTRNCVVNTEARWNETNGIYSCL